MRKADHDGGSTLSDIEVRVRALESALVAGGLVEVAALDRIVEVHETVIGPHIGARAVARAWADPDYHRALLDDAAAAIAPFTHTGRVGDQLVVVENTPTMHNVVVCTLCSCYPWDVLGLPPVWYKSPAYRSRTVKEPRAVLAEFGLTLPVETTVRVWDSTAELRYLVLPMRPAGTDGWSEERLAELVGRDCMIGTAVPKAG
ncbi:nitrile hydratase subunit alpha [Mycolicibacterium arenosum]|uniref:nitrile hydratase n=1 Tax=Mycolicibacterium arenosum TaxID=2952157 RepID=A0ABT1M0R5_9MYCO|nr:nitrile hydratase subunit alpha [Mycolicibacterium sp. CAU 1645]MCP9272743.1 nitrile hydratase subunit alpha [Mycolicibacterium sp. CAU 1645]